MALESRELFELFLALAPARLSSARRGLEEVDQSERAFELRSTLIPLAVDAALLGAEGLRALASAIATAPSAPAEVLREGLDELERAIAELQEGGDRSGARVDETALIEHAERLARLSTPVEPLAELAEEHGPPTRASGTPLAFDAPRAIAIVPESPAADAELSAVEHWQPQLAEDMVAAFLDECAERTEGLAQRLLELEERGAHPELVSEIFRDLHTLKGSSGFAGLNKLNRLAHVAEDRIGELRSGERRPDRPLIDLLLEALDAMRLIVDQARAEQPIDVDVGDLVQRLRHPDALRVPGERPAPKAEREPAAPAPSPPNLVPHATLRIDFEKVDLLLNLVGEIVLSRGQLAAGQEAFGQMLRELSLFRARLGEVLAVEQGELSLRRTGTDPAVRRNASVVRWQQRGGQGSPVDDLQRIERVLSEGHADLEDQLSRLGLAAGQLRDTVMKLRMVPIARLFTKYQRTARELSQKLGKQVRVSLHGEETELDKVLVERLEDPLLHLVRNAVDHGIETPQARHARGKAEIGTIELLASQRGGQVIVVIRDDGRGLDPERLRQRAIEKGLLTKAEASELDDAEARELIFRPGFSTAREVSDVSGRGVGMDVVRAAIEKLKGSVLVRSTPGAGTELELRLPLTLAITQVLAVRVAGELVALPLDAVVSAQSLAASDLETVATSACVRVGEALIPVVDLGTALGLGGDTSLGASNEGSVIIMDLGSERLGLLVQQVLGRHEVVIKSLGPLLARTPCAAGASLIGDRIALVVDVGGLAARLRRQTSLATPPAGPELAPSPQAESRGLEILVAEDSDVVRETLERELSRAGFRVSVARDGQEALKLAESHAFDAVCTDILMPNLDGYQLIAALREKPQYRNVPIVVLSSKDARIDSLRGFDAGADAYLAKPTDTGQLIGQLEFLLAQRRH